MWRMEGKDLINIIMGTLLGGLILLAFGVRPVLWSLLLGAFIGNRLLRLSGRM